MYESRGQSPLSRPDFIRRILAHVGIALALLGMSLAIGMLGYIGFEHLSWIDAFLDAAMLLGGMGPVHAPQSAAGKLFAGLFALYAGLVFLISAALIFTPLLHRLMHHFHWNEKV